LTLTTQQVAQDSLPVARRKKAFGLAHALRLVSRPCRNSCRQARPGRTRPCRITRHAVPVAPASAACRHTTALTRRSGWAAGDSTASPAPSTPGVLSSAAQPVTVVGDDQSSTTTSPFRHHQPGRALTLGKCGLDPPVTNDHEVPCGSRLRTLRPATARTPTGSWTCCEPAPGRAESPQRPAVAPPRRGPLGPRSGSNGNPLYILLRAPVGLVGAVGRRVVAAPLGATDRPAQTG